jgi:hypothetical protein
VKLNHYTSGVNLKMIVREDRIKLGKILSNTKTEIVSAVSLTDDMDPMGHGLTNGAAITGKQARDLVYATRNGNQYYSVDNTKYCVEVNIPDNDSCLIKAMDFYSNPEIIAALEIAGYFPHDKNPAIVDIATAVNNFNTLSWTRKGGTWRYYFGDIDLSLVEPVYVRANTAEGWQRWPLANVKADLGSD